MLTTRRQFTASLAALGAMSAAGWPMRAAAQSPTVVRIGVDPYTTGSQMWVAREKGYFAAHGIDAQITTYATGIETLDATLTGNTDIGVGLDFPTALRMQSRHLTILAAIFSSTPGWHKLAVSQAIQSDADLRGRSYGVASGTAQHLVTIKFLENKGLTPADYQIVPFANLLEIVASLKAGRLDAGFVWADGVTQITQTEGWRIMTDDSEAKLRQSAYVSANSGFAQGNRPAIVAMLRAMGDATAFLNENPDEAAAIIAANTRAPVEGVRNLLRLNTFHLRLTAQERDGFATIAEFASGVIRTPVSFDTAVDPSFLNEALPGAVAL